MYIIITFLLTILTFYRTSWVFKGLLLLISVLIFHYMVGRSSRWYLISFGLCHDLHQCFTARHLIFSSCWVWPFVYFFILVEAILQFAIDILLSILEIQSSSCSLIKVFVLLLKFILAISLSGHFDIWNIVNMLLSILLVAIFRFCFNCSSILIMWNRSALLFVYHFHTLIIIFILYLLYFIFPICICCWYNVRII